MKTNKKVLLIIAALLMVAAVVFSYISIQKYGFDKNENAEIDLIEDKKPEIVLPQETPNLPKKGEYTEKETAPKNTVENTEIVLEKETTEKTTEEDLTDNVRRCTLSVQCKQVLENMDKLKESKKSIIPEDGIIYREKTTEFSEGESVFDVLNREMRENGINMEFVKTPAYNSVYIEGIANLYEFDCGTYSGWMYSVNGVTPTVGSSQYKVANGDKIEFFYSCSLMQ